MWIMFAFGSALFAGVTSVLAKVGLQKTDSYLAAALRTIIVLVFSWIMVFVTGAYSGLSAISAKTYIFLCLSGLATGASWICYFRALSLGDVNKVVPIDKSSTILTMLLAFFFLKEPITLPLLFGMAGIALGTYLMLERKPASLPKEASPGGHGWLFYALLSALFASFTSILGKIGMKDVDSNLGTALRTIIVLLMAWVIVFVLHKQREIKEITKKSWFFLLASGLATGMSWLCYYRALQDGRASLVVPIDKLSIVVTIVFARLFLKERLTKKSFTGLTLLVAGTLLLLI